MFELQSSEDGVGGSAGAGANVDVCTDELECKICYCLYNLGTRRPKVLHCRHRLCTKCLAKILGLDLDEAALHAVVCPFCRYVTRLPDEATQSLPDDCKLVSVLSLQSRNHRNQKNLHLSKETPSELLLSPRHLSSLMGSPPPMMHPSSSSSSSSSSYSSIRSSPNFVVITIMEPPPTAASHQDLHRLPRQGLLSSSLDSMASITQRWTMWNCAALLCQTLARVLVWVLGLLYFSSLPMGVYLLIMQRTMVGVLMVSLVPASLVMVLVYGLCQCICHQLWDCRLP